MHRVNHHGYSCLLALLLSAACAAPVLAQSTTTTTVGTNTTTTTVRTSTTPSTSVPPALECQNRAARAAGKLAQAYLRCEERAEGLARRGKSFDLAGCRERQRQKFERRLPKRVRKQRCPPCLFDLQNRAALQRPAEQLTLTGPVVFCDDAAGRKQIKCAARVFSRLRTLLGGLVECRIKDASAEANDKQFDEATCRVRVQRKYDRAVRKLKDCAPCLSPDVRRELKSKPVADLLEVLDPGDALERRPLGVAHCSCLYGFDTCDDGNACTTDSCDPTGGCTHVPSNSQGSCELDHPNPCAKGTCTAGRCMAVAANEGNACPDGDDESCTSGVCQNMLCQPTASNDGEPCADDGEECTEDRCEAGECAHRPHANGTSCGDGDLCNGEETCMNGTCEDGFPPFCPEDERNSCTQAVCDPIVGCTFEFINEGELCQDGDACTFGDVCEQGVCEGIPLDCDDGIDCTIDTCSDVFGCVSHETLACQQ